MEAVQSLPVITPNEMALMKVIDVPVLRGIDAIADVLEMLDEKAPGAAWVGGGYAAYCASRAESPPVPGDVDIFVRDHNAWDDVFRGIDELDVFHVERKSNRAVTFTKAGRLTIQLIDPVSDEPYCSERWVEDFDFTVCRAILVNRETVQADEHFVRDTVAMQLVLKNINHPIGAMMRMVKYTSKGYSCAPSEMVKILEAYERADPRAKENLLNEFRNMGQDKWDTVADDEPFIDDRWEDESWY